MRLKAFVDAHPIGALLGAVIAVVIIVGAMSLVARTSPAGSDSPVTPSATAPPTPSPSPALDAASACLQAEALVKSGRPAEALDLLDAAVATDPTPGVCVTTQRARATAALAAAQFWVAAGRRALEQTPADEATAREYAAKAAAADATGVGVKELQEDAAEDDPHWTTQAGTSWTKFRTDYLEPLGPPLLAALAIGTGLLVLARVLIIFRMPWVKPGRPLTAWWLAVGAICVVAASLGAVFVVPGRTEQDALVGTVAVGLVGAFAWARALSGRLKVTIDSNASDDGKARSATRIVSILRQLGSGAPRGLEVPVGTDVDALDKAITEVGPATWIGTVISGLKVILGFAPWRVVVDRGTAGTSVVVTRNGRTVASTVVRDQIAGPDGPALDPDLLIASFLLFTLADGYRNRASFECLLEATQWRSLALVESVSAERYGGVEPTAEQKLLLLALATRVDGASPFARIALHHHLYRDSNDKVVLEGYGRWLHDEARRYRGDPATVPIRARLLYATVAVALNGLAGSPRRADTLVRAETAITELEGLIALAGRGKLRREPLPRRSLDEVDALRDELREASAALARSSAPRDVRVALAELRRDLPPAATSRAPLPPRAWGMSAATRAFLLSLDGGATSLRQAVDAAWRVAATSSAGGEEARTWAAAYAEVVAVRVRDPRLEQRLVSITGADDRLLTWPSHDERQQFAGIAMDGLGAGDYNTLCTLATRRTMLQAVELLPVALADSENRDWSLKDPTLVELRGRAEFWDVVQPTGSQDVLAQPPFAEHAEKLRAAGLATPAALRDAPRSLVEAVVGDAALAERVIGVARLAAGVPPGLGRHASAIVAALLAVGIANPETLVARAPAAHAAILAMPVSRSVPGFDAAATAWLQAVSATGNGRRLRTARR